MVTMAWNNLGMNSTAVFAAALLLLGCGDDKMMETTEGGSSTGTSSGSTSTTEPTTSGSTSTTDGTSSTTEGTSSTTASSTGSTTMMTMGGECDPRLQDCDAGQKCTAYYNNMGDPGWNANQCVPEPQDGGIVGDPCQIDEGESVLSGLDNCAKGYFCFNFDFMTGQGGACIEFCNADDECPNTNGGNAGCVEGANEGTLPICLPKCDPLIQDCPDGQGCYGDLSLPFFICATPDTGMGTGVDDEPCEFTNACAPGFSCEAAATQAGCDGGSMGCCTPFCSVMGGNGPCDMKEECVPFYPMNAPPGLEDVGVCAIPQ